LVARKQRHQDLSTGGVLGERKKEDTQEGKKKKGREKKSPGKRAKNDRRPVKGFKSPFCTRPQVSLSKVKRKDFWIKKHNREERKGSETGDRSH